MRLIFIRHADPDYTIDSLTEKGWKEAELLSRRLSSMDIKAFYCSPLGRARDTASLTLQNFFHKDRWKDTPLMCSGRIGEYYREVAEGIDSILKKHGYERYKNRYRTKGGNRDTIVVFCHFGVMCVMLSHILGISPLSLWHGFCAAPSSVTTLYTEEREEGEVFFRCQSFGDTAHLYVAGEEPAFAARFCETYDNMEERH